MIEYLRFDMAFISSIIKTLDRQNIQVILVDFHTNSTSTSNVGGVILTALVKNLGVIFRPRWYFHSRFIKLFA